MVRTVGVTLRAFAITALTALVFACAGTPVARIPTESRPDCGLARLDTNGPVAAAVVGSMVMLRTTMNDPSQPNGRDFQARGYGIVVESGVVLTPAHVVRSAKSYVYAYPVRIKDGDVVEDGGPVLMGVSQFSSTYDAALLVALDPGLTLAPLPAVTDLPEFGDRAYVLCGSQGWRSGQVTNPYASVPGAATVLEANVTTVHGDSGSPLVNGCGQLIGFVSLGNANNPHSYYVPAFVALQSLHAGR